MPRKPKAEEPPPSGRIENLYEKIPKELLDEAENPNFNLHHLKLPFRMCIVAPSGSGKTNFLCNLIGLFSRGKGTFQTINIITRNKDEPLYKWITSKSDQINIKEAIASTFHASGVIPFGTGKKLIIRNETGPRSTQIYFFNNSITFGFLGF
jgi:hypothetical protein